MNKYFSVYLIKLFLVLREFLFGVSAYTANFVYQNTGTVPFAIPPKVLIPALALPGNRFISNDFP